MRYKLLFEKFYENMVIALSLEDAGMIEIFSGGHPQDAALVP